MDKKEYDRVENPLKKACVDPERYYNEMMAIIRSNEIISYPAYVAFTTTPVIELIQKTSQEDKVDIAGYLFKNTHSDLEVRNITELPMEKVLEIKKQLMVNR